MERSRFKTFNSRKSFLNDPRKRFTSSSKSTNPHYKNSTTEDHNNDNFRKNLLPSSTSLPEVKKSKLGINSGNKSKKAKMRQYVIYVLIVCTLFIVFDNNDNYGSDTWSKHENDDLVSFSELMRANQMMKNQVRANLTSNNELKVPINKLRGGRFRKMIKPLQRRNNQFLKHKIRKNVNESPKGDSSLINGAASQLIDAIHQGEGQEHVQLTITVNNGDGKDNINKSHLVQRRSSGLQSSPGVPLPNQNLERSILRKKIYKPTKQLLSKIETFPHQISNLNCALYNGPEYTVAQELVYWEDIQSDSIFEGPFYQNNEKNNDQIKRTRDSLDKYLTFQPDTGGFNNNRMAFETALVLSVAMGRTLVLPPRQQFPLMSAGTRKDQFMSFDDIFHLDSLDKEYEGVNIITMEEFIFRENLHPPKNATDADGSSDLSSLWNYLEHSSYVPESWNRNECVVAFPSTSEHEGNEGLIDMLNDITNESDGRSFPHHLDYQGKPVSPDALPIERLREIMAGRSKLCLYTEEMQSATIIHLPTKPPHTRLLTHFYSFIFFEDWIQATWMNRLVRDHLRYSDEIMCAAARVTEAIRQASYTRQNTDGIYHSLHVRRKNFHPKEMTSDLSSNDLLESLSGIEFGSNIFVATDDLDKDFFMPLQKNYKLYYLKDFQNLLRGLNPNYYGMIEQVVASQGESFHGMFYSSFSGYVNRLRGYYSVRDMIEGSNDGVLRNSYYIQPKYRNENRIYKAVQKPFFAREFPVAWRNINDGIEEMDQASL